MCMHCIGLLYLAGLCMYIHMDTHTCAHTHKHTHLCRGERREGERMLPHLSPCSPPPVWSTEAPRSSRKPHSPASPTVSFAAIIADQQKETESQTRCSACSHGLCALCFILAGKSTFSGLPFFFGVPITARHTFMY